MSVGVVAGFEDYSEDNLPIPLSPAEKEIKSCARLRMIRMIRKKRQYMSALMAFAREEGYEVPDIPQQQTLLGHRILTDYGRIADANRVSIRPDEPFHKSA